MQGHDRHPAVQQSLPRVVSPLQSYQKLCSTNSGRSPHAVTRRPLLKHQNEVAKVEDSLVHKNQHKTLAGGRRE